METHERIEFLHGKYRASTCDKAKDLAIRERPSTKEEARLHFTEVRAKYQDMVLLVNASIHPITEQSAANVDTALAKQESSNIDKEVAEKRHRLQVHQLDHPEARGSISVPIRAIIIILITLVALASESLWLSGAFMITGEPRTRATLIALGVTIIMGTLAHATVYAIRKVKGRKWKLACAGISLLIASATYYVLGTLRAKFLNETLEYTEGLATEPWMFTLLSLAVYVAIGAFSLLFFPSLDEIDDYRTHRNAKRELKQKERELAQLEAERKAMPRRLAEKMEARARAVESARALKLRIREMHRETHHGFAQTNALRRMTPPPPELFEDPEELIIHDNKDTSL